MNDETLKAVVEEIAPLLRGRAFGKIFQRARAALAIDFRTGDGRYLYLSVEPNQQRLYLFARAVRELEKQSHAPTPFALTLRKHLGGATLQDIVKDPGDRIVRLFFEARDATGDAHTRTLVAQLTGRSANLFLLDAETRVVDAIRTSHGEGQEIGDRYAPPPPRDISGDESKQPTSKTTQPSTSLPSTSPPSPSKHTQTSPASPPVERGAFPSLSAALDDYFQRIETARLFDTRAAALSARLRQSTDKLRKLRRNLERDLAAHGDAVEHKRAGDLLLANIANAERRGSVVRLTDYYADDAPTVELEIDETRTLQEEAAHRFARYTKARRAAQEIAQRLAATAKELDALEAQRAALEPIIDARDAAALEAFAGGGRATRSGGGRGMRGGDPQTQTESPRPETKATARQKASENVPGARRYRSSDGFEILVGRAARDNDHLTFRVARSQDLWLHAADYPGSHVVVRNHTRGADVPHRTVIEAAQLAAHFSQAGKDSKVAVHYTPRKFVSKIKGGAPGLVRLSSFHTLMVEPRESVERI